MKTLLTQSVVDEADLSIGTERWIADTKIKGFGLRIWRRSYGTIGKAYALRFKGENGHPTRKTFETYRAHYDVWDERHWDHWFDQAPDGGERTRLPYDSITLGDLIEHARRWAQDEIDKVRGRKFIGDAEYKRFTFMTLDEEEAYQQDIIRKRIESYSLARVRDIVILNLKTQGISQQYIDRLDKVFDHYVPEDLKAKLIINVDLEDVRQILDQAPSISNLKILRGFLGRLVEFCQQHGVHGKLSRYRMAKLGPPKVKSVDFMTDGEQGWQDLFQYLEDTDDLWQQALCLRFYFLAATPPLSKVMSARWDQMKGFDFLRPKRNEGERFFIDWIYGTGWRSTYRLSQTTFDTLIKARDRASNCIGDSPYCFPSPSKHHIGKPITSVSVVWDRCLSDLKLPLISPKQAMNSYLAHLYPTRFPR
ncbi:hypothetical protein ACFFUB_07775 [Algimonas porphyrae]|uniref:hypothetical protein n=1 Tax=Algimonas porphyrae TaxID=1128113 RepID=UPI0024E06E35|nr:hypothetical protein [Algimonas porphyrae]